MFLSFLEFTTFSVTTFFKLLNMLFLSMIQYFVLFLLLSRHVCLSFFNRQWRKEASFLSFWYNVLHDIYCPLTIWCYTATIDFTFIKNSSLLFNFTYNLLCSRWVYIIDISYLIVPLFSIWIDSTIVIIVCLNYQESIVNLIQHCK